MYYSLVKLFLKNAEFSYIAYTASLNVKIVHYYGTTLGTRELARLCHQFFLLMSSLIFCKMTPPFGSVLFPPHCSRVIDFWKDYRNDIVSSLVYYIRGEMIVMPWYYLVKVLSPCSLL